MNPLISVIVCTYNRPDTLQETLKSLQKQETQGKFDYEVIVVENHAAAQTKDFVSSLQKMWNGKLHYLVQAERGKSRALAKGIEHARGSIIAFTDDDVVVDAHWLFYLFEAFQKFNCSGVGGRVLPDYPSGTPQWVKDNAVRLAGSVVIYDYGEGDRKFENSMYPFIGANYAFLKSMFDQHGTFRTDLGPGTKVMCGGEDTEFVQRLANHGKALYYCGKAVVWHPVDLERLNLRHVARWNFSLGNFDAQREMQSAEKFAYFWGAPRYLSRGVLSDTGRLVINVFNKPAFYIAWRDLFRKLGMIQEYRTGTNKKV